MQRYDGIKKADVVLHSGEGKNERKKTYKTKSFFKSFLLRGVFCIGAVAIILLIGAIVFTDFPSSVKDIVSFDFLTEFFN